jgi:hypothetical protein
MPISPQTERTTRVRARQLSLTMVVLLAVIAVVPSHAVAKSLVPFQATIAETFTATLCSPTLLCISATGSGQAAHLGETSESAVVVSDLASNPAPGCHTETRTTTLTAANGDQVTMDATGQNCSISPTTVTAVDSYVVTGGTGRYSGATGSGTTRASIDLASGIAVVTFSGTLSTPGSVP